MARCAVGAFLLASLLTAQNGTFHVEPVAFGMYRTGGDLWAPEADPLAFIGFGVVAEASAGKLQVITEAYATQFFGLTGLPQKWSPEHGFSWSISTSDSLNEFSSDYTSMKLTYQAGDATLYAGKLAQQWGPGMHSLFLSNKSPTYPQIGFDWPIIPSIHFSYFHGELFSGIRDTREGPLGVNGSQKIWVDRYIAAHRFEWRPTQALKLAFNESVVYGGKPVETMYLLPFIMYFSAEHFLGDADNVQIQLDISWNPSSELELYGAWLMDDWEILDTFNKDANQNHFGWLGGLSWEGLLRDGDRLRFEGSWTDARIYRHIYDATFYDNRGYPLGHWTGAHAQSLELRYALPAGNFWLQAEILHARRGQLTRQMLQEQYSGQVVFPRFAGGGETFTRAALHVYHQVAGKLWLEGGISLIHWVNGGFKPATPAIEGVDSDKVSLNFGFFYNFSLPGYSISNLLEN